MLPQRILPAHGSIDMLGTMLSFACAIHCMLAPLLIVVLSAVGLGFIMSEAFELIFAFCTILLGTSSISIGFMKHRQLRVFILLGIAILCLVAGIVSHAHGQHHPLSLFFLALGGTVLAISHLVNHALCRKSCCKH